MLARSCTAQASLAHSGHVWDDSGLIVDMQDEVATMKGTQDQK